MHHHVDLTGREGKDDLASAILEFDVLARALPVPLQGNRARLPAIGTDVGLARDAGVRGLARLRKRRRLGADWWQCGPRVGRDQEAPDLGLDVVVAALSHPPLHQSPVSVEEVLRRPGVIAEGLPCRKIVVECDRIGEPVVADPTIDVLGARPELELGRVHADHDQAAVGVVAVPRLDIGRGADPVDAGVLPEIDQDDLATQRVGRERC